MTGRGERELIALRELAENLAARTQRAQDSKGARVLKANTGHLLAALVSTPSMAADLLRERRLDTEVLLKAARMFTDDEPDAIVRAVRYARDLAKRAASREPGAIDLLAALCRERKTAAVRALEQCGADVGRLRLVSMQIAMGLVPARRPSVMAMTQRPPSMPPAPTRPTAPQPIAVRPPAPAPTPVARAPQRAPQKKRKAGAPSRFALDPRRFPTLTELGTNLTLEAARGELDPVVGRDGTIDRTLDILAKRHANCPLLIGAAGVGKTSVVRGIALRIATGEDVASLDDRIIIEIAPASLLAGTGVRGSLAERLANLRKEVALGKGRIVLFFDEIHALFGPEAGEEAASELKVALAKGELPTIGATTVEEFRKLMEPDAALARRFTTVDVEEPSPEEAFLAIEGILPAFEEYHEVDYTKEALISSVQWSVRYVPSRALPDKAVSILDLAGARARRRGDEEVTAEHVAEVVSEIAHVPIERLLESDADRMLRLEALMGERVVGHEHALTKIAAVLRRNASGLRARRPIGTFLLLGPTGVGKTETAKAIAECLFFSADAMTRIDMSEYAEPHSIARLLGAPPGYVGHEAGGQLTESVRRRPYQVLLLDEVEKAHRDVLEAFLQVFDEGRMTDGRGRTVDFTNVVIILTSNLGADAAQNARGRIGFGTMGRSQDRMLEAIVAAARSELPPELYNRLDEVLAYAPLTKTDVAAVAGRLLARLRDELLRTRGVDLQVSDHAITALLDAGGFDPELGARPMRRTIGRLIEAPISEMLLRTEIRRGDVVIVDVEQGTIVVDAVTPSAAE